MSISIFVLFLYLFNTTFNNISVISWQSVLLVGETSIPRENHQSVVSHLRRYHIMLYRVHLAWAGFKLTTLVVIGTDWIGSYKSNYHKIDFITSLVYSGFSLDRFHCKIKTIKYFSSTKQGLIIYYTTVHFW